MQSLGTDIDKDPSREMLKKLFIVIKLYHFDDDKNKLADYLDAETLDGQPTAWEFG